MGCNCKGASICGGRDALVISNRDNERCSACGCHKHDVEEVHDECKRTEDRSLLDCAAAGVTGAIFRVVRGVDNFISSCGCCCNRRH